MTAWFAPSLAAALLVLAPPPPAPADPQPDTAYGEDTPLFPVGMFHGSWRIVAADDRTDAALMRLTVQHSRGEPNATGDFVIYQPFCGLRARGPVVGDETCELDGMADVFSQAQVSGRRLVLVFHPTADGLPHRLVFWRRGASLNGYYEAPDFRRAIVGQPSM